MPSHSSLAFSVDSASVESQDLPRGAVVGDFRIDQLIRRGHSGYVYRARDTFMQRDVALKEYFPDHMACRRPDGGLKVFASQVESFDTSKVLFMMEAIQLSRMNHASVAKVSRVWEAGGTAYVTMPLYQGRMLSEVCATGEVVPTVAWVEQFVRPLLDFIGSLHRRSIYGVELSIGNVMLLEGRYPLIMSLGPRFSGRGVLDDSPVVPPQAWSDVQALARMILEIIGPMLGKIQYPRAWISSLQDAASGVPGRRAANVFELMKFSGLDDRRRRSRVPGDSALIEAGGHDDRGTSDVLGSPVPVVDQPESVHRETPTFTGDEQPPSSETQDWAATTFTALYFDQPQAAAAGAAAKMGQSLLPGSPASTTTAAVVQLPARRTSLDALEDAERRSSACVEMASPARAAVEGLASSAHAQARDSLTTAAAAVAKSQTDPDPSVLGRWTSAAVVSRKRPPVLLQWIRSHWATLAFLAIVALLVANLVATLVS
jgi:hypothetical protein